MSALQPIGGPTLLRLLALGLLVIGLLAKPMLAAACDIQDLRQALGGDTIPVLVADDGCRSGDTCCLAHHCGECCVSGMAVLPVGLAFDRLALTIEPVAPEHVEFRAPPRHEALRPPIRA